VSLEDVWIVILYPSLTGLDELDEDNYEDTYAEKDKENDQEK
jgi:hypothetical protein